MSDTKEQDHMTSKSTFLSCEKIFCHISKKAAGISSFCCFAAMSAVDLGQEISLSDRYFLLLQATIKGSKVLRAQVAERTEKEEDVNRLTVKLECRSFRLHVVSPTLRSIRLHDQSRFAYTVAIEDR